MSQVGSNLRLSQLHPLRPSHTDQSQGSFNVPASLWLVHLGITPPSVAELQHIDTALLPCRTGCVKIRIHTTSTYWSAPCSYSRRASLAGNEPFDSLLVLCKKAFFSISGLDLRVGDICVCIFLSVMVNTKLTEFLSHVWGTTTSVRFTALILTTSQYQHKTLSLWWCLLSC